MWPALLSTVLFSISAISGNRTARLLGGTEANFWRLIFAALLLAVYAHLVGNGLAGAALPMFLISGCIGFGVGDVALFQALPRLGSRLSMMFVSCLSAPLAAAIEWGWLGNTMSLAEIGSAVLILGGVGLALAPSDSANPLTLQPCSGQAGCPSTRLRAGLSTGVLFGLMAATCQGYGAVLSRKAFLIARSAGDDIDGITAAYQRILGGIGVTALCLLVVKRKEIMEKLRRTDDVDSASDRKQNWRKAWPFVLLNGLAGPALGVSCYQWALKNTPTGIVLPIVAITPLVIIPFSRYLEGERPTRRSLVGGAVAVIGAVALAIAIRW